MKDERNTHNAVAAMMHVRAGENAATWAAAWMKQYGQASLEIFPYHRRSEAAYSLQALVRGFGSAQSATGDTSRDARVAGKALETVLEKLGTTGGLLEALACGPQYGTRVVLGSERGCVASAFSLYDDIDAVHRLSVALEMLHRLPRANEKTTDFVRGLMQLWVRCGVGPIGFTIPTEGNAADYAKGFQEWAARVIETISGQYDPDRVGRIIRDTPKEIRDAAKTCRAPDLTADEIETTLDAFMAWDGKCGGE